MAHRVVRAERPRDASLLPLKACSLWLTPKSGYGAASLFFLLAEADLRLMAEPLVPVGLSSKAVGGGLGTVQASAEVRSHSAAVGLLQVWS